MLRLLMELLAGAMQAFLSHDRLNRKREAGAESSHKTKISYSHSYTLFPSFITLKSDANFFQTGIA